MVKRDLKGLAFNGYMVDPERLTLIEDPKHPLFDERVLLPIDPEMVANIREYGVLNPVIVRRNGDLLEVIDGRQRTKNAREANRQLRKEGFKLIRVPIMLRRGEDANLIGVAISGNEIRRPDEILIKAAKAQRMLNHGATMGDIRVAFGVKSVETIENWLKLLDLHPQIRAAVARGEVKYTVAMRLSRLRLEKQLSKWKKLRRAGATNANAVRVVVNGKLERVCPPSKQQLRRVADAFHNAKSFLSNDLASDGYSFVAWVLGRLSTDELLDNLSSPASAAISAAVKQGMKSKGKEK